ncbi:MAG: hypothetical protein CHACPFDD_00835 [Phycisphaerae bacterium]|nr:hypothetical protein [Phycisphaerae bacterium]
MGNRLTEPSTTSGAASRACPGVVRELVERFERNREAYKSSAYNETQVRREFIDPLFAALGWDVWNESGLAEAYKDVIHEDAIKVGGATKAPDYCFRIGGTRKFFLEAKKPAVGVRDDPEPAYQLRRYAWSARLPLSILTDFEELAVYDCRIRPNLGDPASSSLISYLYVNTSSIATQDDFRQTTLAELRRLPIPDPRHDPATANSLAAFARHMLDLHAQLAAARTAHDKTALQRQIVAADRQIDRLVYDLYGLTADEIRIVEDANPNPSRE